MHIGVLAGSPSMDSIVLAIAQDGSFHVRTERDIQPSSHPLSAIIYEACSADPPKFLRLRTALRLCNGPIILPVYLGRDTTDCLLRAARLADDVVFAIDRSSLFRTMRELRDGIHSQTATKRILEQIAPLAGPRTLDSCVEVVVAAERGKRINIPGVTQLGRSTLRAYAAKDGMPSFRTQWRWARALQGLLRTTELAWTAKKAACEGGVRDTAAFSRLISETTGLTMKEWQRTGGFASALEVYVDIWIRNQLGYARRHRI